jgi:hypothetical protein
MAESSEKLLGTLTSIEGINPAGSSKEILPHYHAICGGSTQSLSSLSAAENEELVGLLHELFKGYPVKTITLTEIVLENGARFAWRPPKTARTEDTALNDPSLMEQFLSIYIPGPDWQSDPRHDGNAGRFRHSDFFRAVYGEDETAVKGNLTDVKWLGGTAGEHAQAIPVTRVMNVASAMQSISEELDDLSPADKAICWEYLQEIAGTFCWRTIAGTSRLSAHSFGMTLDLNARQCQYWLWDLAVNLKAVNPSATVPLERDLTPEEIPPWRNTVPFKIVEIFEKYGFIWGGKWTKFDTMHFEYRPECFVAPEIKLHIRRLLAKAGYQLVEPLAIPVRQRSTPTFI